MASGDPSHKQQASVSVSTSDTGTATPSNDPKVPTDTLASPAKPGCGVPVDSEGKAKIFRPWSLQRPHHLTFHLVWSAFLTCQFATFSAAALAPVIRENLNATASMMSGAGIAAVRAVHWRLVGTSGEGTVCSRAAACWLPRRPCLSPYSRACASQPAPFPQAACTAWGIPIPLLPKLTHLYRAPNPHAPPRAWCMLPNCPPTWEASSLASNCRVTRA